MILALQLVETLENLDKGVMSPERTPARDMARCWLSLDGGGYGYSVLTEGLQPHQSHGTSPTILVSLIKPFAFSLPQNVITN